MFPTSAKYDWPKSETSDLGGEAQGGAGPRHPSLPRECAHAALVVRLRARRLRRAAEFACLTIRPIRTKRLAACVTTAAAALAMALGLVLVAQGLWIHAKALVAQVLLERAFAETLTTGKNVKPWSWADTWPVARIEIPRLGKRAIVLNGGSGQALAFGPGHLERTPDAGEPGTAVYAAHRDTHFAFIGEVRLGDEILVTRRDGAVFRYRAASTAVVPWDASGIDPQAAGHKLVLATCWPLDARTAGPLRYLVRAELISAAAAR
jgi:sortase A